MKKTAGRKARRGKGHHHHHGVWDAETARWYARVHGNHPTNRIAVRLAGLAVDDEVLDIGCGPGAAVRAAARVVKRGEVIGVDPSMEMIRIASRKAARSTARRRLGFRVGSAEHLPLQDASVTVALAINSLHHWADPKKACAEVLRVLAPGGRVLVVDEATKDGRCAHGDGPLGRPQTAVRLLKSAGFSDVGLERYREGKVRLFIVRARRPG